MGPSLEQQLPAKLGSKSIRALTQPIVSREGGRRTGYDIVNTLSFGDNELPLPDPSASWRTLETQRKYLLNLPYTRLIQIALDLSPEVNKGMSDFLRFANPGTVLENRASQRAEQSTNEFIRTLNMYYGSWKSHLDSAWAGVFVTGGLFPELVLDPTSRYPVDLVFNDPTTARFSKEHHPVRGYRWRLFQRTAHGRNYLDDNPLVKYLGFDRLVDSPYGRPIIGPSAHSSVFLLGLIQDLRRAIANTGFTRADYSLDATELLSIIDRNPDIAGDDEATAQFIDEQISSIKRVLDGLDVDDDYVHLSTVNVNYATSPMQVNMNGLNTVVDTLQRNVVNGFKGISALSNVLDSTTETHIRSQLEYYVSALQSLQDETADVIEQFLDSGNQVQGISSETYFRFKRQRTADRKASAEIEQIRTDTVIKKVDAQIISTGEAKAEIDGFRDELEVV